MGKQPAAREVQVVKSRGLTYEKPFCRYCGKGTRRLFVQGAGKSGRLQHSNTRVCARGHKAVFKRGVA